MVIKKGKKKKKKTRRDSREKGRGSRREWGDHHPEIMKSKA